MELTLVLAILALALILSGWRMSLRSVESAARSVGPQRHSFHCVVVEARGGGCEASRRLDGVRFLASEAPQLPLAGCSQGSCECVYRHFEDRRYHMRRSPHVPHLGRPVADVSPDRRLRLGRRKTDLEIYSLH